MECNKEEAVRAKDIAEKKMHAKDFVTARKFALKAQQLYPDMDNISQLICVCNVHCSAENKMFGNEMDWYGILEIEQTADETLIKKQYRKFALLLHPDKNKFAGAEAAFKLIGEAQRVLLDKEKRSVYDMRRRTPYKPVMPNQAPQQASRSYNVVKQSRVHNNFTSNPSSQHFNASHQEPKQQAQSGVPNGRETFWTMCPFCAVRYQYYQDVLNRALRCQGCKKPFIAYDMQTQGARLGSDATQPVFPRQGVPNVNAPKSGSEAMNEKPVSNAKPASNARFQAGQNAEFSRAQKARQSQNDSSYVDREGEQGSKPFAKVNGRRGKKQMVDSSESFDTDSSLDSEGVEMQSDGDVLREQRFDSEGDRHTRRSSRNKRHVSYNENVSDDEETVNPSKRAKGSGSCSSLPKEEADTSENQQPSNTSKHFGSASASIKENRMEGHDKPDGSETVFESMKKSFEADNGGVYNASPEMTPDPTFHEYPDPEFSDFDKDREEHCFKVGQIWAAYDTLDAMPRFYARIRRIFSPGFKVRITWLEADPDDEFGKLWVNSELPFSCGKFKNGNSEITEDRLMFSHVVSWDKGVRDSVKIYPRKGETWALFKKWDAEWYLSAESDRKFEYEFVEILSEYDEIGGVRVAHLGKLKGFASLFCRKDGNEVSIPPAEVLRFSHRVLSCRMTGDERNDVPKGSFELDPACISFDLEEITLPELDGKTGVNDLSSKSAGCNPRAEVAEKPASSYQHKNNIDVDINGQNIPDPEFYNFDVMKCRDNFQVDQVWALYSDVDGLPKYYGLIRKIDPDPSFKLHISWLEPVYLPSDMAVWKDKNMPICCGRFKIKAGKGQAYENTSSFSHELRVEPTGKRNMFSVYPRKGEVWALYKNWYADMKAAELENCEYDIVEILEENDSQTDVLFLERVHGFNSVFKAQKNGSSPVTREIPRIELLRFSHQIPSFKLTNEKDGSLRGFWELDPAALPANVLYRLK